MTIQDSDILLSTAKIIMQAQGAQEIVEKLFQLYKDYFSISRMDFLTLDYNTGFFQDFVRDWIYVEEKNRQKILFAVFNSFQKQTDKFIINGRLSSYNPDEAEVDEIKKAGSNAINLVYFPLYSKDRTFGLIEVQYEKINQNIEINSKFFQLLQIILLQISTAVYNHVIINHMATGLNFYDAMKNIAKLSKANTSLSTSFPR